MSVLLRRAQLSSANLNLLYPALAFLLTVFAIAPLAYPGYFQSYTGYGVVYNLIDLHAHLAGFYAWSPTWGHGYDFLRMDGPLGYWFAEIFHLVGASFMDSIKLVYALSFLISAFGMFKLAQRVFQNDGAALVASAVYVYFPAHISALYVRGAFGETVAWALFPLALWCAIELETKSPRRRRDSVWTIVAFLLLMLAQPGLAILFGILTRVWLLVAVPSRNPQRGFFLSPTVNAILLGLVLGILIQLPALAQQASISAANLFVPAHIYPFQFLTATWGTDIPTGNFTDNAPYQIGFGALALTILAVALLFRSEARGENPTRRLTLFAVITSAVLCILMTPLAAPMWDFLGLNYLVQYPFQLLAFVGVLLPFAAASIVTSDTRFQEIPLLVVLLIVPLLAAYPYLAPEFTDFAPTKPALARFNNDELTLLDAQVVRPPGTWRHGATVEVDLSWQALKQPNHDYTVFVHVLDEHSAGKQWGAADDKPQGGTLDTLQMTAGRVYSDTHTVQIDLNGPPEGYHMELGVYQTTTQERATTETGADFVRLMSSNSLVQTPITINRSASDSGLDAVRRFLTRLGIQIRVDGYFVALAAISLLALLPMIQAGYFWGAHDARHAVYFSFEFDRVFRDGVLYPRWFPDMTYGYGYPLFNIYGPLAFYVGEAFHLIGFDFVTTVKLVFALAWVTSGLAMYGFVKRVFEHRGMAFIAGLLFVFMPYHMIDVYVRAAFAETVALPFLPLTLWAFYESITTRTARSMLFVAVSYAGMLFAHNGIALLFSIVLGAWIIFLVIRTRDTNKPFISFPSIFGMIRNSLASMGGLALGLGLTGIFLIPLALEYRYINVAQWTANYYNYQDHFVDLYQLFSPFWGFGISNLGPVDGLSFQIGLVPVILFFASLFVIAKNPNNKRAYLLFFFALSIAVLLLMFDFSLPAWRAFSLASVAQFPWRLLTLTMVSFSIVGASVMLLSDGGRQTADDKVSSLQFPVSSPKSQLSNLSLSVLSLGALILIGSYPYITDQNLLDAREAKGVGLPGLMKFENSANEMTGTTVFADQQPLWSPLADNYVTGKAVKSKIDFSTVPDWLFIRIPQNSLHVDGERVDYNAPNGDATIVFNVQMYPGWHAYLTPSRSTDIVSEIPIQIEPPYGRIKVTIPQGEHGLWLRFQDTPPRTFGTILSGVSLLIALGLFVWSLRVRSPKIADKKSTV